MLLTYPCAPSGSPSGPFWARAVRAASRKRRIAAKTRFPALRSSSEVVERRQEVGSPTVGKGAENILKWPLADSLSPSTRPESKRIGPAGRLAVLTIRLVLLPYLLSRDVTGSAGRLEAAQPESSDAAFAPSARTRIDFPSFSICNRFRQG